MKKILIFCSLLLTSLFFVSCGNSITGYSFHDGVYTNDNPAAFAVILGNHANAMAIPQDAYNSMEELFQDAVYGGYVCVIVADSTPTKVELAEGENFFSEDAKNATILQQRLDTRSTELTNKLKEEQFIADTSEVDLLAAIREAKNVLSNSRFKDFSNKQIIIVDTGISTAGELNFIDFDFLSRTPEISDVINQLNGYEGIGVLPDLSGITVTFIGTEEGLAETAEPQKVSITDKKYIKDLWNAVITACGADAVRFESAAGWDTPNIYTEDSESKYPYVSAISFSHNKVISFPDSLTFASNDPDSPPNLPEPPTLEAKLASEMIGFKPDKSDYLNEENARNTLRPFAEELNTFFSFYPDQKIWIVGTTASAAQKGGSGSADLSMRRAEMVKNTLVTEFDVPEDKLLTIGLGAKFPWSVDEWENGSFDTTVAQQNRAVWLLTEDSDLFKSMLDAYEDNVLLPEAMSKLDALD